MNFVGRMVYAAERFGRSWYHGYLRLANGFQHCQRVVGGLREGSISVDCADAQQMKVGVVCCE
jgi:hypothetical protein